MTDTRAVSLPALASTIGDAVRYVDEHTLLLCARWQDVIGALPVVDAVITDPPYSERTHDAYSPRVDVLTACERDARWAARGGKRRTIDYVAWSADDVLTAAETWLPRCAGWACVMCDDILAQTWRAALALPAHDRYSFAPLAILEPGSRVRLAGDGPSNWATYLAVSRPRSLRKWGTLPGGYVTPPGCGGEAKPVVGGKPVWLMKAIVSDYSRPGDLILDPCAGGATTAIAARDLGRRCIVVEMDPSTCELARKRIERHAAQVPMFRPAELAATQEPLL